MSNRSRFWPLFVSELPAPWEPSADIYRTPYGWVLKLDLAGVRPEDVAVSISGQRVTISGVRRDTIVEEGCSYYAMEISYNRFERSLEMPVNLANAQVTIEARNGLLLVRMITEGE
jgi:HSP20 family protein